jgi:YidC/Oxa1 family membrane protein insertase
LVFAVSGVYFPLGVVLYWLTSNLWTMGQQFYVIRRNPAPGTPAEEAHRRRMEAKAKKRGEAVPVGQVAEETAPEPPVRQQPKRNSRAQRRRNAQRNKKKT